MPREFAATRFSASVSGLSSRAWLVWLLALLIAAQSALVPAVGRDCVVPLRGSAEEESDSRECPGEEESGELVAAGLSRELRINHAPSRTGATDGAALQRQSAPRAVRANCRVEMTRRNGVGSLLRC
jgi:hypothetical protein